MLKFSQVTIILFSAVSCFNGKQQGTDSGSINFVPLASGILLSCLMFNAFEFHRTNQRIHLYLIFQGTFLLLFSSLNLPLSLTDQYTFPVKKYDFLFFIFNLASASLFTRDFFTGKQFAPLKKRSYPGFVFISGWVILSLGFLLDSKILFSNQPGTEDTSYGTLTGMALQVLFSTIALSQRNSIFLQEKFKSQQSEIIALNASEKKLEAIVRKNADEMIETIGEIAEKNQNITDSIIYSLTIQRSILPPESVLHGAFKDYFLLFRPKDIVSGDFYWFCKSDKYTFVAAADCTGHGVPGALMSLVGNNFLNQIVNEKSILEPSKILGDLNRNVRIALNQENENTTSRDGMDICLCRIGKDEVLFAGARRPLYIVSKNKLEIIKGDRMSIGGLQKKEKEFTNHRIALDPDHRTAFYLTTDGFTDQPNPSGQKIGSRNLIDLIEKNHSLSGMQQQKEFTNFLDSYKKYEEQRDDITVLSIFI